MGFCLGKVESRSPVIQNVNNSENNVILRIIKFYSHPPALDMFQFLSENVLTNSRRVLLWLKMCLLLPPQFFQV